MKNSVEVEFSNTPRNTRTFLEREALVDGLREDAAVALYPTAGSWRPGSAMSMRATDVYR